RPLLVGRLRVLAKAAFVGDADRGGVARIDHANHAAVFEAGLAPRERRAHRLGGEAAAVSRARQHPAYLGGTGEPRAPGIVEVALEVRDPDLADKLAR